MTTSKRHAATPTSRPSQIPRQIPRRSGKGEETLTQSDAARREKETLHERIAAIRLVQSRERPGLHARKKYIGVKMPDLPPSSSASAAAWERLPQRINRALRLPAHD